MCLCLPTSFARALEPPQPAGGDYNIALEAAVESFREGDFQQARAEFAAAHALNPSARTLRGLGLSDFEAGNYALAITELEAALLDQRKPLDADQRSEVQAVIAHARTFVGTLEIQRTPPEAVVTVEGAPLSGDSVTLDAGLYTLRAQAPGYADLEQQVEVLAGAVSTARVALVPSPPDATPPPVVVEADDTQRTSAWIVGGLGVTGVIVGSIFGVRSIIKRNESDEYCGGTSCRDMRGVTAMDDAIEAGDVSTVAFVVGGIALGVGTVLLITAPDGDDYTAETARTLKLDLGPGAVRLRGEF